MVENNNPGLSDWDEIGELELREHCKGEVGLSMVIEDKQKSAESDSWYKQSINSNKGDVSSVNEDEYLQVPGHHESQKIESFNENLVPEMPRSHRISEKLAVHAATAADASDDNSILVTSFSGPDQQRIAHAKQFFNQIANKAAQPIEEEKNEAVQPAEALSESDQASEHEI